MKKIFLSILLAIMFAFSAYAQDPELHDSVQQSKYDFNQFGRETLGFTIQPTKWNGGDWLTFGLVSASTFLMIKTADEPIRNGILKNQQYYNSIPIKIGNMWGDWYPTVVIGGAFALHGLLDDNPLSNKIAFEIAQSGLYTEFVTQLVKHSSGRARPYNELGSSAFKPFSFLGWDFTSFPAGHTTWAFSLSTVLSRNTKHAWLKVLVYLPAALTFIARIYQDHHWTSDNFIGAALGYFIANWVVDQHEKPIETGSKKSQIEIRGLNIQPFVLGDSYGLGLTLHF
ncbi:MAG: phosphatase PAP2 family protein [Melioribacteraceae bacterium]